MAIRLSEDKELVEEIRQKLKENKDKYGEQFCPCVIPTKYESDNKEDYICMCKEFREQEDGECHCGLYIKEEEQFIHKNKQIFKNKRYEKAKREIGNKYERLKIIDIDYDKTEYEYSLGHYYGVYVICECECTNHKTLPLNVVKNHIVKSCGCLSKEVTAKNNIGSKSKINKYDLSGAYGIGWTTNTNEEFYFDLEDYDKIKDICWSSSMEKNGYKYLHGRYNGKLIKMHRLITDYTLVDHNNRNTLDNRKSNLKNASKSENNRNHKLRKDSTSGISGVNWDKKSCKWRVRINSDINKRINLGIYSNFEEAVKVRLEAEKKYYGEFAPHRDLFEKYNISLQTADTQIHSEIHQRNGLEAIIRE